MATKNKNIKNSKCETRLTLEDERPSEILIRRQNEDRERYKKARSERDVEIMAKANHHIEILHKYINESEEIKAYLILNEGAEYLSTAVYEVFWKEVFKAQYV